jgi:hypothetical protein
MKRCFLLFSLFSLLSSLDLSAQTAQELEALLQTSAVSRAQAAGFVLRASGALTDNDADGAFALAVERGWLPKNAVPQIPITLAELSFLVMKAFDLKGGAMYALLPGPRYAYRTMLAKSFITAPADPSMILGGERFLLILGNVLTAAEDGQ